jgi:L-histidine Nalpha-methyltransferase
MTAIVTVHSSQFPENVRRDLLHSLRARSVNHKFHYDTYKQSQKWLALHEAHSPARTDPACLAIYDEAFAATVARILTPAARVIGLGSGGGQKDARLLSLLAAGKKELSFTPCDVSLALLLISRQAAHDVVGEIPCDPLLCDLATAGDLPLVFGPATDPRAARLFTFFGMIPNFEPALILPCLSDLVRAEDWLLFSANLAPGSDYAVGVQRILPGYDNPLTRDWLTSFLFDLGFAPEDGGVQFGIETSDAGLKRVVADFCLTESRIIALYGEEFEFHPGEKIRLFFSYRYTPERVRAILHLHQLKVTEQWLAPSGEEGVFLCQKAT